MIKNRKSVLFLINSISDYRVATYNRIAEEFDLTMAYLEKDDTKSTCIFKKIKVNCYHIRSLKIVGYGLRKLCKNYDVVMFTPDLHNVDLCLLPFLPHKYKTISWSIGIRASYTRPYQLDRKHNFVDKVFAKVLSYCDATIVYMDCVKQFWTETEIPHKKIFVAKNTTPIYPVEFISEHKKDFIFVGTLYKKKGLDKLIESFKKVVDSNPTSQTKLQIVGGGAERDAIEQMIENLNLGDKVIMHGPIYEESMLASLFQKSIISISPTQAGLSVAKSMGYGVPFVTRRDAITGGEIYHITNDVNGIIYDNDSDLPEIMSSAINHRDRFVEMGLSAKNYYDNNATVSHMAQGVIDAIKYSLSL